MAGSQLKQLKASLRERGRLGPTPSKKQKKQQQEARRLAKQAPPPEFTPTKKAKFDFLNGPDKNGSNKDSVARERREQARRDGIVFEMQRRQKVGGIVDRRFGEDDPTMTPEERAMERFVREKQRSGRKSGIFDLEDDDEEEGGLTHLGRPLGLKDDFNEVVSDDDVSSEGELRGMKRRRLSDGHEEADDAEERDPDRPKTKKEVMEEVIAKSKLHKYERQKAKEDDDDLRAELDTDVADIFALLGGRKVASKISEPVDIPMNPERAALLNGDDREKADREYDMRLRAMVQDKRSQPTTRTKTEEEKAEEDAERLRRLEQQRLRRMKGEESEDDADMNDGIEGDEDFYGDFDDPAEQKQSSKVPQSQPRALLRKQDVEDEDDFELDDDLIANDSDAEALESNELSDSEEEDSEDDDQEFIADILTTSENGQLAVKTAAAISRSGVNGTRTDLAFTYPCPQSLSELLAIVKDVALADLPTVVQRIRALYHPQLAEGNKDRLAAFAAVLVEYVSFSCGQKERPSFSTLESLIRHVHSLARAYPERVSIAFRERLEDMRTNRFSGFNAGDMVTLIAIGSIYPTSDHFHQVVTPAILTMTRYLEHGIPLTVGDLATGTLISTILLSYQKLSQRYVPEVVNYILIAIQSLYPERYNDFAGPAPAHATVEGLRIQGILTEAKASRSISFWDVENDGQDLADSEPIKLAILETQFQLISTVIKLWKEKSAFPEIALALSTSLGQFTRKPNLEKLPPRLQKSCKSIKKDVEISIKQALLDRKPLTLHNHRPLAIKMSVPKFEDSYNPEKRYDPDTERAESNKLRAEHKKERKAVIREFRKEARAEATVQLEDKKARDEAYEKKYRRLVAEIQGEEGRESKAYEREKAARKSKK